MKTQLLTALSIGVLLATSAHADVAGQSSNDNYIQVGGTELANGGPDNNPKDPGHTGEIGSPGIGVHTSKTPFKKVSLNRLEWFGRFNLGGSHDNATGLTQLQESHDLMPKSHKDFGHYAFSSVKTDSRWFGNKLYFGEWSDDGDFTDSSHTVYYVGKDKTSSMPTTGKFSYDVKGINNAGDDGIMTSNNFSVDFSNNKVEGTLSKADNSLDITIDATINPSTASFAGTAIANQNINGNSKGEFFGTDATALGGIATFDDKQYDTAFAGTKGTPITN